MRIELGIVLLAVACMTACAATGKDQPKEVGVTAADPRHMPTEVTLYKNVPVVGVRLTASDAGYTMSAFRASGTPTSAIDQSRDVIVQALGQSGQPLSTVTVDNPRAVRTAGSKRPGQAIRPSGDVTVFFAKPDQVRSVSVSVLRGPNEGFKQVFRVDPSSLPRESGGDAKQQ